MGENTVTPTLSEKNGLTLKSLLEKKWSGKYLRTGLAWLLASIVIQMLNLIGTFMFIFGDNRPIPYSFSVLRTIAQVMAVIGVSGYWIAIPAFQKWWHTKRWLALIAFAIALVPVIPLWSFFNWLK